jgi:hypothetical protein
MCWSHANTRFNPVLPRPTWVAAAPVVPHREGRHLVPQRRRLLKLKGVGGAPVLRLRVGFEGCGSRSAIYFFRFNPGQPSTELFKPTCQNRACRRPAGGSPPPPRCRGAGKTRWRRCRPP